MAATVPLDCPFLAFSCAWRGPTVSRPRLAPHPHVGMR